jgi:endonuclease YncB( thermonuclease family)
MIVPISKRAYLAISLLTLTALTLLLIPAVLASEQFRVTRVTDGDTIRIKSASTEITIRLVGIDAPEVSHKKREPGQPFSQQATKYLAGLVFNKSMDIKEYGHDRYGRTLAVVVLDGKNVNLAMVRGGFAEVYRGEHAKGFDPTPYLEAEKKARARREGIWVHGDGYVSLRDWRTMQKAEHRLGLPIGYLGQP